MMSLYYSGIVIIVLLMLLALFFMFRSILRGQRTSKR
jgi:hypothetical protein